MNLLRKYYDKDSIGGGIPDEPKKQIWVKPMDSLIDCFNDYEDQISRLKEENERLRGGLIRLLGLTENIESMLFHHNHSIDGWHLNGDLEPIMNFVADMDIEAITAAKELLTPSPTTKK